MPLIKSHQKSQWCLVGNIIKERHYSHGGEEIRFGTKHFSRGTKVYCLPAQWGDGYDQIVVVGRHRGSKKFKTMIISSRWVENWRVKEVYNPEVLRRIYQCRRNWKSRDEVEMCLSSILEHIKHDKVTKMGIVSNAIN